ncbi:hypothetical protein PsorP6_005965 [Peronosclerospora sorghi]|uniref:Uncharacterized protein n=1 Tax=Peronosclerospora sorghi TaxID=230839 RepID=A0ACC0W5X5_9STRA|nr:hypothetical protein PsorP6_005965 [Peronosclerospora sorghi]
MGCSQSKNSNQIVERASVDSPAIKTPTSVSISAHDVAVEAPTVTVEDLPPAPPSVPLEVTPKTDKSAVPSVEDVAGRSSDPVEEDSAALAQIAPLSKTAAPVEDTPETQEPVEEQAHSPKEIFSQEDAEAVAPASEPMVGPQAEPFVEEEAPKSELSLEEVALRSESAVTEKEREEESKSEDAAIASVGETKTMGECLVFTAADVTFNDKGVAFYNFDGSDGSNPANDVHVCKRYSEFQSLHSQLTNSQEWKTLDLPTLPRASFLQNRKNQKMLEERKTQFLALLNAVASHSIASQSDEFRAFLA